MVPNVCVPVLSCFESRLVLSGGAGQERLCSFEVGVSLACKLAGACLLRTTAYRESICGSSKTKGATRLGKRVWRCHVDAKVQGRRMVDTHRYSSPQVIISLIRALKSSVYYII